jgi:hypothetical protein
MPEASGFENYCYSGCRRIWKSWTGADCWRYETEILCAETNEEEPGMFVVKKILIIYYKFN